MEFDPDTTISDLLQGIPSAALVLHRFGIRAEDSDNRTVQQICADYRVQFADFMRAFDDIDWQQEAPTQ
jgi:hypothetical protein